MITLEDVKTWKEEAQNGPTKVVYDDIGEDYKQRSVVMTFRYERYMALLDEVMRLSHLNASFARENNNLREGLEHAKELLRAFPGCGNNPEIDAWMADVTTALS